MKRYNKIIFQYHFETFSFCCWKKLEILLLGFVQKILNAYDKNILFIFIDCKYFDVNFGKTNKFYKRKKIQFQRFINSSKCS